MKQDNSATYRPDLVKFMTQNDFRGKDSKPAPAVKLDKDQVNANRKAQARWLDYTSGNAYVLYVQNRTNDHSFRVVAYGKTPVDGVKRWYRGLDGNDKQTRVAVRVVAVYTCVDSSSQAGDLLMGQPQDSFPY